MLADGYHYADAIDEVRDAIEQLLGIDAEAQYDLDAIVDDAYLDVGNRLIANASADRFWIYVGKHHTAARDLDAGERNRQRELRTQAALDAL